MPLLTFQVGGHIDKMLELPKFPPVPWNLFVGTLIFYSGLNLGIKSTHLLYKLGGGLPWGEAVNEVKTKRLVTTGIYEYIRNPMVLGYSVLPMGMGLFFQSLGMALSITPIVLAVNIAIVKLKEEPNLRERFGKEYDKYKDSTPFLFPHPLRLFEAIQGAVKKKRVQIQYISISIIGLILLSQMLFKETTSIAVPYQSSFFLGFFSLICFLGFIASVSPRILRLKFHNAKSNPDIRGHHPDCEKFKSHILVFKDAAYCAGCSGLAIGAILSLIIIVLYSIFGLGNLSLELVFWFGGLFLTLGMLQHYIDFGSPLVHFLLNIILVGGVAMIILTVDFMGTSIFVNMYTLAIILFWISARIRISQEEHIETCNQCSLTCTKGFRQAK
jgi:protein-S-isoprenylcysteine O-methyltransferase Ste14